MILNRTTQTYNSFSSLEVAFLSEIFPYLKTIPFSSASALGSVLTVVMDVESVRSGHSQRSDRSRRSQFSYQRPRLTGHGSALTSYAPAVVSGHSQIVASAGTQPALVVASSGAPAFFHPGSRLATPQHGTLTSYVTPAAPGLFSQRGVIPSSLLAQSPGYHALVPQPGPAVSQHQQQQHVVAMDGEQIEVQILPGAGDDVEHWGDATTAVTSDTGTSYDGDANGLRPGAFGKDGHNGADVPGFDCARSMGSALAVCLGLVAFLSPIAMLVLPRLAVVEWQGSRQCNSPCFGQMVGLSFKMLILMLGTWALFFRNSKASMPRVFFFRSLVLFLIFIVTFAFWLFYGVRVLEKRNEDYYNVVLFAVSLVDTLLFIHYLAVVLLELRHLEARYSIRVVRSPDGESHSYRIGEISIQRAAVFVLQNYMTDFQVRETIVSTFCMHLQRRIYFPFSFS